MNNKPTLSQRIILSSLMAILLYLVITWNAWPMLATPVIERADLVVCKRENGGIKEQWVIPVDSVSRNYIVAIDWNVFEKSKCELLQKCARIENYRIPSDEIATWDIIWFTCTWNIIYPEKI